MRIQKDVMAVKQSATASSALQTEGRAWDNCGCFNQKTRKSTMLRGCPGLSAAELRLAILRWGNALVLA
eukprot:1002408-Rhodomonas_salina.1